MISEETVDPHFVFVPPILDLLEHSYLPKLTFTTRCLTSWYGVIAETTILSEGKSKLHWVAKFNTFESAGVTGSVGLTSFLACWGSRSGRQSFLLLRSGFLVCYQGTLVVSVPVLHS
jgi:hypothetical protein